MATVKLEFNSPRLVEQLYCGEPANIEMAEELFGVSIVVRDNWIQLEGPEHKTADAEHFFNLMAKGREQGIDLRPADFRNALNTFRSGHVKHLEELFSKPLVIKIRNKTLVPKTINQKRYLRFIEKNDIVFGVGPAGTGKTYLAVAAALQAYLSKEVDRIILSRPAVEAGEALGFLPGDLTEKIQPYLMPLYDAIYDLLGKEEATKLIDKGAIDIAPLAYMRGRTLNNACVILDEAQNTTSAQMMMFLTRLGENSRMIITGDITQVDLPKHHMSGLKQATHILSAVEGIKFFYFETCDVVRHPLVARIINAYDHYSDPTHPASKS